MDAFLGSTLNLFFRASFFKIDNIYGCWNLWIPKSANQGQPRCLPSNRNLSAFKRMKPSASR